MSEEREKAHTQNSEARKMLPPQLLIRTVSSVVGVPIVLGFLFLGKIPFFILILIFTVMGLNEFYFLLRIRRIRPNVILGTVCAASFLVGALLSGLVGVAFALLICLTLSLLWMVFSGGQHKTSLEVAYMMLGALYVGFLFSHLILINSLGKHGTYLVLLVLIATWVYDIAAYAAGSWVGKRKLAPSISPNKTWEGTLFAIGVTIVVLGAWTFFDWISFYQRIILGIIIGIMAPLGDLVESKFKREARVKDTGSIIPGHGGILDRFDSLLFTGTAAYYLLKAIL